MLGMPESCNGTWNNIMTANEDKIIAEYGNMYQGKYNVEGTNQYLLIFKKL